MDVVNRMLRLLAGTALACLALSGAALAQPVELVNLQGNQPAGRVPAEPVPVATPPVASLQTPDVRHTTEAVDVGSQQVLTPGSVGGESQRV